MKFSELIKAELDMSSDLLLAYYKTVRCDFDGAIEEYPIKDLVKSIDIFNWDTEEFLPEGCTVTVRLEKPVICVDILSREEEVIIIDDDYCASRPYIAALVRYFEKTKDDDILDVLVELGISSNEEVETFACYMIKNWKSYYMDTVSDTYKYIHYTRTVWDSFNENKDYGCIECNMNDAMTDLFLNTLFRYAYNHNDRSLRSEVLYMMLEEDEGEGFVKYVMKNWVEYFKDIMLEKFNCISMTSEIANRYRCAVNSVENDARETKQGK